MGCCPGRSSDGPVALLTWFGLRGSGAAHLLPVRDLRLDETRKLRQRFLPPEIAGLDGNDGRKSLLDDGQLGAATDRS